MSRTTAERLAALIGVWDVEAVFPEESLGRVAGRCAFEPLHDGRFVLQRCEMDHPEMPDTTAILAAHPKTGTFQQHYFDSRGVVRLYAMTFVDPTWTLLRVSPDFSDFNFCQRFSGSASDDGRTITGAWEKSDDGADWQLDFDMVYARRDM